MPSTLIRSFRYNAQSAELSIVFQSGRRYVYRDVPEQTYQAMQASFSKGTFFNSQIRDRFDFVEVAQDDVE